MISSAIPIKVLLALPDLLLNSALSMTLSIGGGVEVGTASSWSEMEEQLQGTRPGAAIVDILVGNDLVLPHLGQLVAMYVDTRFIVCTRSLDPILIERTFLAGGSGIVGHDIAAGQLINVIQATCRDDPWPDGVGKCATERTTPMAQLGQLTARQKQVFRLLKLGHTHKEIAAALGIKLKTVEHHASEVRKGFGLAPWLPGPWEHGHRGRKP